MMFESQYFSRQVAIKIDSLPSPQDGTDNAVHSQYSEPHHCALHWCATGLVFLFRIKGKYERHGSQKT